MDYTLKVGEVLKVGPLTDGGGIPLSWKLLSDGAIEEVRREFTPPLTPPGMVGVTGELFITVRALRPGGFTLIRATPWDANNVVQRFTGEVVAADRLAPPAPPEPEEKSMLFPAVIGIGALGFAWFLYRRNRRAGLGSYEDNGGDDYLLSPRTSEERYLIARDPKFNKFIKGATGKQNPSYDEVFSALKRHGLDQTSASKYAFWYKLRYW